MKPPEDPLSKLSEEEFKEFMRLSAKNKEALDCNKFRDVLPEVLCIEYERMTTVFERHFRLEDFPTLYEVLGPPSVTSRIHGDAITDTWYNEVFTNLQVEDFIRLIKTFTISFIDFSHRPICVVKGSPEWTLKNEMHALIYQRNLITNIDQITDTFPQFILEAPNLYIKLFNDTGDYRVPLEQTSPSWNDRYNQRFLQRFKLFVKCDITKVAGEKERYKVDVTTPEQFIQLIKCGAFIYRFRPQTDIVSLIYSQER